MKLNPTRSTLRSGTGLRLRRTQGGEADMGRVVPLIVAAISLSPACGCGGLGWYRAVGHFPGVAPTDYAFYVFDGTSSQLFQFPPPQVESALFEALGDLGFKVTEPPVHHPDGEARIHGKTPDGRPVDILLTPQNAMTNVRVKIGPAHLGDEILSRDLLRRVALNFGTVMRVYTPMETTLPRKINPSRDLPPQILPAPPATLTGEGLRPGESRDKTSEEEAAPPGSESRPATTLPSPFSLPQGFVPTRDDPNPPNMPYAPFPYTPFNDKL
ncbi:MAG: DUF3568 family protein [Isosphaeraceae bacterium]